MALTEVIIPNINGRSPLGPNIAVRLTESLVDVNDYCALVVTEGRFHDLYIIGASTESGMRYCYGDAPAMKSLKWQWNKYTDRLIRIPMAKWNRTGTDILDNSF